MRFKNYTNLIFFVRRHYQTLVPFLTARRAVNVARVLFEKKLRKIKLKSRPFIYRIDPCSTCNYRCASCETPTTKTLEKRIMSLDDFRTIIDKIRHFALRASLYDVGEPFLNKDIYNMFSYAYEHKISTLISTNFSRFQKEDMDKLFESKLTVLEPCLDGYTQHTYGTYRKGGSVEIIKDNIISVMEEKRKRKAKYPIMDVQVVMFDHIKHELPMIIQFLTDAGIDKITLRPENLGFNSKETTISNKDQQSKQVCYWLYIGMMIRPDGKVYPCCGMGFDRFSYGNILEDDLNDIWNNKYYQFSRSLFKKGPDLGYRDDMKYIPCLKCELFKKSRMMKPKSESA